MIDSLERVQMKIVFLPPYPLFCLDVIPETVEAILQPAWTTSSMSEKKNRNIWVLDKITESLNQLSLKLN